MEELGRRVAPEVNLVEYGKYRCRFFLEHIIRFVMIP